MMAAIQQFMQREAEARNASSKPSFLFGIFPMDWNIQAFSIQSMFAFVSNPIVKQAIVNVGNARGLGTKFLNAVQMAADDIRHRAQQAGPQNVNMADLGNLPPGTRPGDSHSGHEIG